jgi:hypothetical protein
LYYYRARWYDPQLVNFIERDPIGYHDSANLYQALNYSPMNFTDPFGEWFVIDRIMTPHRIVKTSKGQEVMVKVISRLYTNDGRQLGETMIGLAQGSETNLRRLKPKARERLARRAGKVTDDDYEGVPNGEIPPHGTFDRRRLVNGDTPFGVYMSLETGWHEYFCSSETQCTSRYPKGGAGTDRARSFGWAKENFEPIFSPEAEWNYRSEIRHHGGGRALSNPWAPRQELLPTQGCMRFCNIQMLQRIEDIKKAQAIDGHQQGIYVVGDDHFLLLMAFHPGLREAWRKNRVFEKTGLHYIDLVRFLTLNFDYPWAPGLFIGAAPEPNPTPTAPR